MEITIIGSGTGEPSLRRGFPGILLRVKGRNILIDSGSGTLKGLLKEGVTYLDIHEIYYTHLHCDHVSELAPILFAMRNMTSPREKDLYIFGPAGLKSYYDGLLNIYASTLEPKGYRIELKELGESRIGRGAFTVLSLPIAHTGSSIGCRFEEGGKSFVFSGDTGYCRNIVSLGKGADLLVLECSAPDEFAVEGHLTPFLAGRIASEANARRLVLTHMYPVCDSFDILGQCRAAFKGNVSLARDGMKVEV